MSISGWLFEAFVESVASSAKESVSSAKESASKLGTEVKSLTDNAVNIATQPSVSQQHKPRDKYKARAASVRAKQEERWAGIAAKNAVENEPEMQALKLWKNELEALLEEVNKEITEIDNSRWAVFWRASKHEKTTVKDALITLLRAHSVQELQLLAQQQKKTLGPNVGKPTKIGAILERILAVDEDITEKKEARLVIK